MYGIDKNDPRLSAQIVQAEHRLPEAVGEPPAETSARYRRTGLPRWLALAGIVLGFCLLIFPGVVALRSYRRWQDGTASEPRAAWSVLSIGLGIGAGLSLWRQSPLLAIVAGLIVSVSGLSLSGP